MENVLHKLKEIRLQKGFSGDEVAKLLGKSGNHVISRIENGETKLNLDILNSLCNIYGITPSSLFSESKIFHKKKGFFDRISYRAEDQSIPPELKATLVPYLKDLRKIGSLQEKLKRTPFDPKEILKVDIDENLEIERQKFLAKKLAKDLRKRFDFEEEDHLDIVQFITYNLNIPILAEDLGEKFWGFYSKDIYGVPLIVFNMNNHFEGRKRFTLAHELGHYILHNDYLELDEEGEIVDSERVVNAFAQELLVPTNFLRSCFDEIGLSFVDKIKPIHVATLATRFKVSFLMMSYALKDLGKINWNEYKEFKIYSSERLKYEADEIGYRTSDYVVQVKPLSVRIKELAIEAKAKGVIGIDELSKITGMSIGEIKKVF